MGCSVLGRDAEPLVRTQFLEHPPTLNFWAYHLKKWIQHPQKTPSPFFPHITLIVGVVFGGGVKELEHSSDRAGTQLEHLALTSYRASYRAIMGCSVLGRGAEPLVRTQFLEHPRTLNFGAHHLKERNQHPQKPLIPFLSPHNPHCRGGFWGGGQRVRAQLEQS